jgi:hypothetical protein
MRCADLQQKDVRYMYLQTPTFVDSASLLETARVGLLGADGPAEEALKQDT